MLRKLCIYRSAISKYNTGGKTGLLGIPHWLLMTIICIGLFFFVLAFVVNLYRMFEKHKTLGDTRLTQDEIASSTEVHSEF